MVEPFMASITSSTEPAGHLHQREPVGDLDGADVAALEAGLAGDRADQVLGPIRASRPTPKNSRTTSPPGCRPCGGPWRRGRRALVGPVVAALLVPPRRARRRLVAAQLASGISSSSLGRRPPASCASFTAASATSITSNSSASVSTTTRNRSRSSLEQALAQRGRGSAPAAGRAGRRPSGPSRSSIRWPVTRSMFLSSRCSRGSARVIATPSRPARPTRPMRCT